MASNGGVATPAMVAEKPVLTLLSGPAAGVLGGAWTGAALGPPQANITFDVGGTSADIGLVVDGTFSEATARDTWIAGYPVIVPMIDIHTIGAGGGSIAHVDPGGAFRVGPRSAGAEPGPAAYGRGGTDATVTDANLVLGRLESESFLGGEMKLDLSAARRAVADLAGRLGLDEVAAAEGVLTILNSNMANAIRSRTIQKGIDPRGFSLVAFGGAGPLHGAEVAAMLELPEVIVPVYPGITSALGLLTTDLKYDAIKTEFQVRGSVDLPSLNEDFGAMEADLARQFTADGLSPTRGLVHALGRSPLRRPGLRAARGDAGRSSSTTPDSRACGSASTSSTTRSTGRASRRARSRSSISASAASGGCRGSARSELRAAHRWRTAGSRPAGACSA